MVIAGLTTPRVRLGGRGDEGPPMFFFYFNRLGCVGSVVLSLVLSGVLILALRSCNG